MEAQTGTKKKEHMAPQKQDKDQQENTTKNQQKKKDNKQQQGKKNNQQQQQGQTSSSAKGQKQQQQSKNESISAADLRSFEAVLLADTCQSFVTSAIAQTTNETVNHLLMRCFGAPLIDFFLGFVVEYNVFCSEEASTISFH